MLIDVLQWMMDADYEQLLQERKEADPVYVGQKQRPLIQLL